MMNENDLIAKLRPMIAKKKQLNLVPICIYAIA